MSPILGLTPPASERYISIGMKGIMNEVIGAPEKALLQSVPWHPKSLERRRKRGMAKVLRPMIVQRARFVAAYPDKNPEPRDGLYYCVRFPVGWYPLTYRFDDLPELDHSTFWQEHVAPILACVWAERTGITGIEVDQLESELYTRQYAFPRGRVQYVSPGSYRVSYGEDLPAGISKDTMNWAIGLPDQIPWEKDRHETCLVEDREYVRKRLEITETWPAVDQLQGHVRVRTERSE